MRKLMSCVLMMTLLLTGCGKNAGDRPEDLAAQIRGEYLSLSAWNADVDITAEFSEKVFNFTVKTAWSRKGDTVLTVTKPDLIAGITARIRPGETILEYDGAGVSLGELDSDGLTPISAIPALMERITKGYMARCSWGGTEENRTLLVCCRDPELEEGRGTEYTLCFDPDTHALLWAEVAVDGVRCLELTLRDFTMELNKDETGTDQNLG